MVLVSAGGALPARGQTPPSDPRDVAMPIFNEGLALVQEQRWSDALDRFHEALSIYESPTIVFNVAYCERALGRFVAALETFQRFVAMRPTGVAATRVEEAEGYIRELEARLAHLTIVVPAEQRDGLEVLVDGRQVALPASGALELRLDPGAHTVQARRDGYQPLFVDRASSPGSRERVVLRLEPRPARLSVSSNVTSAEVFLDGERIGTAPLDTRIAPGRHALEVRRADFVTHEAILNVASGDTARVQARLVEEPTPITARWWFWTGVVAIVAGAAVTTWALTRPAPEPPPYDGGNLGWVVGMP
jgi:hypothetical protein